MALTYPLSLPSDQIMSVNLRAPNAQTMSVSPFTFAQQVIAHQGQRWEFTVALPPMLRAEAEEWVGFLLALHGQIGTFLMGDPSGTAPRGSAGGTPLVNGADQTGSTLLIDGATASQTPWIKSGDYFQLGSGASATLHKLVQDADSDVSGQVTLEIWPDLRSSPDNGASLTLEEPVGVFRLASSGVDWSIQAAQVYGITFGVVESI